jgi:Asp-tRNA(Asn)/Glu-tRNA(Gln) amidotransferase A subunit family amidase
VQLVGRAWDEATLFRIGRAFQAATSHHLATPPGQSTQAAT